MRNKQARWRPLVFVAALALVLAACDGGGGADTTEGSDTTEAPATTGAPETTEAPATTEAPLTPPQRHPARRSGSGYSPTSPDSPPGR